jgi:hypothetical protein
MIECVAQRKKKEIRHPPSFIDRSQPACHYSHLSASCCWEFVNESVYVKPFYFDHYFILFFLQPLTLLELSTDTPPVQVKRRHQRRKVRTVQVPTSQPFPVWRLAGNTSSR